MSLLKARLRFTHYMGRLLFHATDVFAFDVIVGETLRSKEAARWNAEHCKVFVNGVRCEQHIESHLARHRFKPIGIANSLHIQGLAVDLLVIKDGQISNDEEPYKILGELWERQFRQAAWGGHFGDMGHFSHAYRGRK